MKHAVTVDGVKRDLDIRAMDESFIVYCKLFSAPMARQDLAVPTSGSRDYVVREFFRKQIRIIGSCLVLAWDGDGVIGKMHFTTREMHEAIGGPENWVESFCYCVDHGGFAPKLRTFGDDELDRLLRSESKTLRVLCVNVGHTDPRWHGQGIATAMLEHLKQWARERGWRRIEARSCADITPTTIVGDWMLRRGAFERRGFHVTREIPVPSEEASRRLREIEAFLSGKKEHPEREAWYVGRLRQLASDPVRRSEYDTDYLMACDV